MTHYIQLFLPLCLTALWQGLALGSLLVLARICLGREQPLARTGVELLLLCWLACLNAVTGFSGCLLAISGYTGEGALNLVPLVTEPMTLMLLNFLLFLPMGLLLPAVFPKTRWSWRRMLLAGAGLSLVIETVQYFGGRAADIDDLAMNAVGAAFGYLLYLLLQGLRQRSLGPRLLTRMAGAWMGAAAFFTGASFVCMR